MKVDYWKSSDGTEFMTGKFNGLIRLLKEFVEPLQ